MILAKPEPLGVFCELDTSENDVSYLLESFSGAKLKVSPAVHLILSQRWDGATFSEIAEALADKGVPNVTAAVVEERFEALTAAIRAADAKAGRGGRSHLVKFTLIPERVVEVISRPLTTLYSAAGAGFAVTFTVVALAIWVFQMSRNHVGTHSLTSFAVAYGLFFVSLLFHEFGHAAASKRFGQRPGPIGFTLYLTLPALYADVTNSWKLPRMQRTIVDAGGTYFQLLFGAIYVVLYAMTGRFEFQAAIFMIVAVSLLNLNPLFKFDGYWILSDLLGIANLSKQAPRIASAVFRLCTRKATQLELPWPRGIILALAFYALAGTAAWVYFLDRIAYSIYREVVTIADAVGRIVHHQPLPHDIVYRFIGVGLALGFSLYLVVRLLAAQMKFVRSGYVSLIRVLESKRTKSVTGDAVSGS